MKSEDILKMIREGSLEALEGLAALESMSKNLSIAAKALGDIASDAKKVIAMAEKISKKIHQ